MNMQAARVPSVAGSRRSVDSSRQGRAKKTTIARAWSLPFPWKQNNTLAQRQEAKSELLELISPLGRGASASPEDQDAVDALASTLEGLNPTPKPLSSPLVNGKWELLYTTSASILGLSRPPLFRPSGPIFQVLDAESLTARNIESGPFFNQVSASLTPVSSSKVAVQFQEFRIFNLIPVKAPPSAKGELDITYLDDDLRISRGDKGNLFVLRMADPSVKP